MPAFEVRLQNLLSPTHELPKWHGPGCSTPACDLRNKADASSAYSYVRT